MDSLYHPRQVYVCVEEVGVLLVDLDQVARDPAARLWAWKAGDSPEIAPEHRKYFRGESECKPVLGGTCVLICSSWDGGVALVRRADKKCLFYALGSGAHSADLIDGRYVAAILSNDTGQLRLYDLGADFPARPVLDTPAGWTLDMPYGHGAVWDAQRRALYALSTTELVKVTLRTGQGNGILVARTSCPRVPQASRPHHFGKDAGKMPAELAGETPAPLGSATPASGIAADVVARLATLKPGGHELFPYDADRLAVSVGEECYLFDVRDGTFAPLPGLADAKDVKCISRHPQTGQVLYVQAEPGKAQSHTLSFVGSSPIALPYPLVYKARWNVPGIGG